MSNTLPIRLAYYLDSAVRWKELLSPYVKKEMNSIAELCPGWSPKIPLALTVLGYEGEYVAIDKSFESLGILEHFSSQLEKKWSLSLINAPISAVTDCHSSLIVANHIIDDVILDLFIYENPTFFHQPLFRDMKEYENAWKIIQKDSSWYSHHVITLFHYVYERLLSEGGVFIYTQYPSYQEKLYGLSLPGELCSLLAHQVQEECAGTYGATISSDVSTFVIKKTPQLHRTHSS